MTQLYRTQKDGGLAFGIAGNATNLAKGALDLQYLSAEISRNVLVRGSLIRWVLDDDVL